MNRLRCLAATCSALLLGASAAPVPSVFAQGRPNKSPITSPKSLAADPMQYVHRGASAKGEYTRTLQLFRDGRALLLSVEEDAVAATVQTGTWKRGARADRLSITLTRQNGKPYREDILLTGTPGKGSPLSSIGEKAKQYGAYGLNFAPRLPNKVAVTFDTVSHATITATGVKLVPEDVVRGAQITKDGFDVLYWQNGGGGGFENEGESLFYFDTLTGKSRRIASFATPITKVGETRLASGLPVLVVSYGSGETGVYGVAAVDPLRGRTVKQWPYVRLGALGPGRMTINQYRRDNLSKDDSRTGTQTVSLDRFFLF